MAHRALLRRIRFGLKDNEDFLPPPIPNVFVNAIAEVNRIRRVLDKADTEETHKCRNAACQHRSTKSFIRRIQGVCNKDICD